VWWSARGGVCTNPCAEHNASRSLSQVVHYEPVNNVEMPSGENETGKMEQGIVQF
jgi:hypothetical protein